MLKDKNKKRIISVLLFSAIVLLMIESGGRLQAVTAERCWRAYELCSIEYGGWLPYPYNMRALGYCGIGLIFCNLYM